MPAPGALSKTLSVATSDGSDQLRLVGPAIPGLIYRSVRGGSYYRILDVDGEDPVGAINRARAWIGRKRPGLAEVIEVDHSLDPESNFYFVRYRVGPRGANSTTLQEILEDPDLATRLRHLAAAFGELQGWWNQTGTAALATPADIVFVDGPKAMLLAAPFRSPPNLADVFRLPARARYLAPGIVRGVIPHISDPEDAYAFTAMLVECLYRQGAYEPEEMLLRAAGSALLECRPEAWRAPAWVSMLPGAAEACETTARLLDHKEPFDPTTLHFRLEDWRRRLDAKEAIGELCAARCYEEALTVIRALLAETSPYPEFADTRYDLAMLGASIAEAHLRRPLDALESLERAIAIGPRRPEAYRAQLELISRLDRRMESGYNESPRMFRDLDSVLWRNFGYLPEGDRARYVTTVSRYLLNRHKAREAADFIYPRIRDPQNGPLAGKFELNLDYVEALLGLDVDTALDLARNHLNWTTSMYAAAVANGQPVDIDEDYFLVRSSQCERKIRSAARMGPRGAGAAV